jgi:DNA-binding PadR family transcriptional regulator
MNIAEQFGAARRGFWFGRYSEGRAKHCGRGARGDPEDFGGGRFWGRGHGGGGPFRFGRLFAQGDLRYVILKLLEEKPRHGYEVIKAIEELLAGMYTPSPGAIYPTLAMLEDLGYATSTADEAGKKVFTITDEGRKHLDENRDVIEALFAKMKGMTEGMSGEKTNELRRAMMNVKRAAFLRYGKKPWTKEQVEQAAAILDQAAAELDKLS